VFLGDGCLMEGISHEACSLAGTSGLGKLIAFLRRQRHLDRRSRRGWFTDDTAKRFEAYGWHVIPQRRRPRSGGDQKAILRRPGR
jgi:transketolase